MNLKEAKEFLGDKGTTEQAQSLVDKFEADAQKLVDSEVKGLKENKVKLLDQMSKLKEKQVPDGFDIEAYKTFEKEKDALAAKQKELEDQELEGKGQWEALKLKLIEGNNSSLEQITSQKDAEINVLKKALDQELIENKAIKAIEKEKGNSFFLLPHMLKNIVTVKDEVGKFSVQVVDKEGNPRLKDDAVTPFKVEDLVAEFKSNDVFRPAFPEMNAGGGGNPNAGGGGGGGVNPWKAETKNITLQAKMNKDNPVLAAQMKKAAGAK